MRRAELAAPSWPASDAPQTNANLRQVLRALGAFRVAGAPPTTP